MTIVSRRIIPAGFRSSSRPAASRPEATDVAGAIADVREYVAVYYDSKLLHSTLGCKTPMNYEKGP